MAAPTVQLHLGDCLDVLRGFPDASVDACVTDPPAGIAFMGKEWDASRGGRDRWIEWLAERLAECLRVAKPGSVLLCWAIPRTSHWTGTAIEDAGWIIEDRIAHHFGSGFPKHKSKLKPATEDWWLARKPGPKWLGVERCRVPAPEGLTTGGQCSPKVRNTYAQDEWTRTWDKPRSQEHPAGRWPANLVMSHSIDCVRRGTKLVKTGIHVGRNTAGKEKFPSAYGSGLPETGTDRGYADPNGLETVADYLCAEDCPIRLMGEQGGESRSSDRPRHTKARQNIAKGDEKDRVSFGHADSGTAARFFPNFDAEPYDPLFYCPKASRKDRNAGCDGMEERSTAERNGRNQCVNGGKLGGSGKPVNGDGKDRPSANHHPCVKPTDLMRWLCRLATPPGGTILDPFMGSGSTGKAAVLEGFRFIGIERDPEYHAIAERRIAAAQAATPLFA